MIRLPYNLGLTVRDSITKYRRKNNIPEPEELRKIYNKQMDFLDDELSLVREITLDKTSLEYINLFPNVTSVVIEGSNELEQADIKNVINSFPNLENLSIHGQDSLQYIDVSSLTKLKDLQIVSNKGLNRIVGIDKLNELSNFVFYDNQTYKTIPEMCNLVDEMSKKGVQCDFDVLYMPDMLKNNANFEADNIKWSEAIGLGLRGNKLQYDTKELQKSVEKAKEIVSKYIKPTDTSSQKYAILYQWMCENVRYDYEALENNYTHSSDGNEKGLTGGTNGTVNGLVYGHCICEGYSKSMQMLLKMCDIPSFDIGCIAENQHINMPDINLNIDGKKKTNQGDHSIIKVNLDGKIYYSDVTWDASRFQRDKKRGYFLLSKEDMEKDHKLIGEAKVFAAFKSVSSEEQEQLFEFAKNRIETVNKDNQISKPKENTEIIAEVNKDLITKRQEYSVVATKMEELMKQNQISPIPNYEQKLVELMKQRDEISEGIDQMMSYQSTLQNNINYDKEQKLNVSIFQVERLLGINITATNSYSVDPQKFGGVPQIISKNTMELAKEQGLITQQLSDLWYEGKLDIKTANKLKSAIRTKYQQMISFAPKPTKENLLNAQKQEQQSQVNNHPKQEPQPLKDLQQEKEKLQLVKEEILEEQRRKKFNVDINPNLQEEILNDMFNEKKNGYPENVEQVENRRVM